MYLEICFYRFYITSHETKKCLLLIAPHISMNSSKAMKKPPTQKSSISLQHFRLYWIRSFWTKFFACCSGWPEVKYFFTKVWSATGIFSNYCSTVEHPLLDVRCNQNVCNQTHHSNVMKYIKAGRELLILFKCLGVNHKNVTHFEYLGVDLWRTLVHIKICVDIMFCRRGEECRWVEVLQTYKKWGKYLSLEERSPLQRLWIYMNADNHLTTNMG